MSSLIDRSTNATPGAEPPPTLPTTNKLLSDISNDAGTLLTQHVTLFQAEMRERLSTAKWCALGVIFGGGMIALGALFLMVSLVRGLVQMIPGLSEWASWLIVGSVLLILGGVAVALGVRYILRVSLVPERTLRTLSESWSWLTTRQK